MVRTTRRGPAAGPDERTMAAGAARRRCLPLQLVLALAAVLTAAVVMAAAAWGGALHAAPSDDAAAAASTLLAPLPGGGFASGASTAQMAAETQAPKVTKQPEDVTAVAGGTAVFESTASGSPKPTVQWERSLDGGSTWSPIEKATSTTLTLTNVNILSEGKYRATFTNSGGNATSNAATLTVQIAPSITRQPSSQAVGEGETAVFTAAAFGRPAPTVQWELSTDGGSTWNAIPGATSTTLAVPNVTMAQSGQAYRAAFANPAGEARTAAATLTVGLPPVITQQPAATTVVVGETAVLEAAASGSPVPTVQWEVSTDSGATWSQVAGATATQLTIADANEAQSGNEYRATFTNSAGSATSDAAELRVVTTRYDAFAWGQNNVGQLGNDTIEDSSNPVPVSGLHFVTSVAAGKRFSLALLADGSVEAWGSNVSGQLGDESNTSSQVPVAVSGLGGVRAISAGGAYALALLANGEVRSWGDNESGQLGTGDTGERTAPVAVKGLSGVQSVSAGADHALALLSNGTVMAWGSNESGQLGTGNTKSSRVPVAVQGLSGVTAVAAGGNFSLALLSDGTVEAWGDDGNGQLGGPPLEEEEGISEVPVQVGSLAGISAIAAGANHALALTSAGTVMAWGDDDFGELGDGTFAPSEETPVTVSGLTGVQAITAGSQDSAALLGNGSVMTWGINKFGTLGDGTSGDPSAVPVTVSGIAKVASVSAGGTHMLAYGEPGPSVTGVSPSAGPTGGGTTVTITGVNLAGATSVQFGASAVTPVNVTSTSLEAKAPPGIGTVDITVTTPTGTSAPVSADRFTYETVPSIKKLSVKSGPSTGGTSVTITGTELDGVTGVKFGSVSASTFTIESATSITVSSPPSIGGVVDVTVSNTAGGSTITRKDHFKYTPVVEGVSPSTGSALGGTSVTVTGSGFAPGSGTTVFRFGKKKALNVVCASSASCTMTTPAGTGTVDVTAQVGKGKGSANPPADHFTFS